jgi:hypothetical protein
MSSGSTKLSQTRVYSARITNRIGCMNRVDLTRKSRFKSAKSVAMSREFKLHASTTSRYEKDDL